MTFIITFSLLTGIAAIASLTTILLRVIGTLKKVRAISDGHLDASIKLQKDVALWRDYAGKWEALSNRNQERARANLKLAEDAVKELEDFRKEVSGR